MLEIRLVRHEDEYELVNFFRKVECNNYFHPHSFNKEYAQFLCNYSGLDLYYIVLINNKIIGYSLLRGWDEGDDIPELGIIVDDSYRGKGLAKAIMNFLHTAARLKGATKIRLKFYKYNEKAVSLYESLGYELSDFDNDQYIGYKKI